MATEVSFPSHFVNPQTKGEDWILQMTNGCHSEWGCQSITSFAKGADRYRLNKLYSLGKQPNDIYKPTFELAEDENSSFINMDYSPLPVIPKFRRITNNKFAKINFHVNAQAIDMYAMDEKSDYEAEERANIQIRNMLKELGIKSEVLNSGEIDQPKDDEELAIKMEFGYKHNQAIDIEKRIDAVFTHERFAEKLNIARDYGFNTGVYAMKVFTDPSTGKVGIRNVDTGQLILSPTKDPYFRDIWYAGEEILMTIDEIRRIAQATNGALDEDQLSEVAAKNAGQNGNPKQYTSSSSGSYAYDSCKVPIFDLEFISSQRYWYEKRYGANGNPIVGKVKKPKTYTDRTYYKEDQSVVYRAKWIPGTKLLFDYGLQKDVFVKDGVPRLSFHIVAPEINHMETSPIIENLIPIVDQICIAWYKLQNVIARARPKGIMIELGALEDISLGDGGKVMQPIDVLDMFAQTGMLVYRRISLDGAPTNYKPIEELENGLGEEAAQHFAVIDNFMAKIRDMIGFNDITDGTTPDPKTLNGVASMATEATNNALHHLFDAEKTLIEMVAEDVACRVHDSIVLKENSPYQYVLGTQVVKSMREKRDQVYREFSMAIEYGSDKFEKERLAARIEKELDSGRITLADALVVDRCRNVKQAEQILAYRIKKNAEMQTAMKKEEVLANAQANADAATQAEQAKQATLKMQHDLEMERLKFEKDKDIEALVLQITLKEQLESSPDRTNKLDIAKVTAEAMERVAKIKEASKPKTPPKKK